MSKSLKMVLATGAGVVVSAVFLAIRRPEAALAAVVVATIIVLTTIALVARERRQR